jgi:hypothetical protein
LHGQFARFKKNELGLYFVQEAISKMS